MPEGLNSGIRLSRSLWCGFDSQVIMRHSLEKSNQAMVDLTDKESKFSMLQKILKTSFSMTIVLNLLNAVRLKMESLPCPFEE